MPSASTNASPSRTLRRIDVFVSDTLADVHREMAAFNSHTGRPSVDPELLMRMLIVGYCYGIRSERRVCEEVSFNLAYRWFCRLDLDDEVPDHVLAADGYLFATPETLAAISGLMKDFFDRTYYPALERINGRPYAILICASRDGQNAARQMERIATGWRLRAVAEPIVVCTHAQTPEAIFAPKVISSDDLSRCEELGAALAAGLAMGIF